MKLDVQYLKHLTKEDFRVLTAIELGQRNHEYVPLHLIGSIAGLRHGGLHRTISQLARLKLLHRERKKYEGYRLTYAGYDYLALWTMVRRSTVSGVGRQIGVGKESDVYLAKTFEDEEVVLKLQRLGRTSFRDVKQKRDYLQHRQHGSWLYLSRLASEREYTFMKVLYDAGFPVPRPIDWSRHCILMGRAPGRVVSRIRQLRHPMLAYTVAMRVLCRIARSGLVHGDYNEFNILVHEQRTRYGEEEARAMLVEAGLGPGSGPDGGAAAAAAASATPGEVPVLDSQAGAASTTGLEEDEDEDEETMSVKGWAGTRHDRDRARRVGKLDWFNEDGVVLSGTSSGGAAQVSLGSRMGRTREIRPGVCEADGVRCVLTAIDFPQMVSVKHVNAKEIFDRDVDCCVKFFRRRFGLGSLPVPTFEDACGPSLVLAGSAAETGAAQAAPGAGESKAEKAAKEVATDKDSESEEGEAGHELATSGEDTTWGADAPVRLDEASGASGFGGDAGATEKDELAAMMLARAEGGADVTSAGGDGSDGEGAGVEEDEEQDLRALGRIEEVSAGVTSIGATVPGDVTFEDEDEEEEVEGMGFAVRRAGGLFAAQGRRRRLGGIGRARALGLNREARGIERRADEEEEEYGWWKPLEMLDASSGAGAGPASGAGASGRAGAGTEGRGSSSSSMPSSASMGRERGSGVEDADEDEDEETAQAVAEAEAEKALAEQRVSDDLRLIIGGGGRGRRSAAGGGRRAGKGRGSGGGGRGGPRFAKAGAVDEEALKRRALKQHQRREAAARKGGGRNAGKAKAQRKTRRQAQEGVKTRDAW